MEALTLLFVSAIIILAILSIGLVITPLLLDRRQVRLGALPTEELARLGADFLSTVKESTQNPGERINMNGYWRDRGVTHAQRYAVLKPLLQQRIITAAPDSDWWGTAQSFFWNVLKRPVNIVVLSRKVWDRMIHGETPGVVIGTSYGPVIWDVSGGNVQVGDGNSATETNEFTPEFAQLIVAAIRLDALSMQTHDRDFAHASANAIENEAAGGRFDRVTELINNLSGIVANGLSIWATTASMLPK